MKKFKVKIDTPWCSKGTIYHYMPYGTYVPDRTIGITPSGANSFAIDHPEKYPDLFEPVEEKSNKDKVEEKSNKDKWYEAFYLIAIKEVYKEENKEKKLSEIRADILEKIAKVLDDHGHIAHHIYKEVCGEG